METAPTTAPQRLSLSPARTLSLGLGAIGLLAVIHMAASVRMDQLAEREGKPYYVLDFNMDVGSSVPTWFAAALLLAAAAAAFLISRSSTESRDRARKWTWISVLLALMSMDEVAEMHNKFGPLVRRIVPETTGTVLHFSWVAVGVLAVTTVIVVFARFWWTQEPAVRAWMAAGAAVFVIGAVGMEMAGGFWIGGHGRDLGYYTLVCIEESAEMVGVLFFLHALLLHMKQRGIRVELDPGSE